MGSQEFGNLTVIGTEPAFLNIREPSATTDTYIVPAATRELDGTHHIEAFSRNCSEET